MNRFYRRSPRRGALLICVVVCMSIVTALATTGVRSALLARRQLRVARQLVQAELLLEAGGRRAAQRKQTEPDYEGETWSLDRETLPRCGPATIQIDVQGSTDQTPVEIEVQVVLPTDAPRPIRLRKTLLLSSTDLPQSD